MSKKQNKVEFKKQQIFEERVQRLVAGGMDPEMAAIKIRREDYESLPMAQKLVRLEKMILAFTRDIGGDLANIKHNEDLLSYATDVNTRVVSRCLELAGISKDRQQMIFEEVQKEFEAQAAKEKEEAAKQELEQAEKPVQGEDVAAVSEVPQEATVFGG